MLRDLTERVVIASKGRFDRAVEGPRPRAARACPSEATTTADEFMDATLDVWELAPESATRVGHPAPFPVELPQRLIDLYTYEGDVVLDPFMGSGTTAVAAVRTGRHYLGYDTDEGYVKAARERVAAEVARVAHRRTGGPARQGAGRRRTTSLVGAGFTLADTKVSKRRRFAGGLQVDWIATDATGGEWLVLVAGRQHGRTAAACAGPTCCSAPSARQPCSPPPATACWCSPPTSRPAARRRSRPSRAARGVALVDASSWAPPASPERLAAYAAGGRTSPVGELLPGL